MKWPAVGITYDVGRRMLREKIYQYMKQYRRDWRILYEILQYVLKMFSRIIHSLPSDAKKNGSLVGQGTPNWKSLKAQRIWLYYQHRVSSVSLHNQNRYMLATIGSMTIVCMLSFSSRNRRSEQLEMFEIM